MKSIIIGFGLLILCLLILFRIGEINFIKGNIRLEVIVAIAAMVFFFAGLYFNHKWNSDKIPDNVPYSTVYSPIDFQEVKKSGLTHREHEVLLKMSDGLSNQAIAQQLFLSESTVKTHVSNILFKLNAKGRMKAVEEARRRKII